MWGLVWKGMATRWRGSEPTRGAFDPSIVKTGRRTRGWGTRLYLGKVWRTGREFFRQPRAWAALSIIWSSKRAVGSLRWRRRASAWRDFGRRMLEQKIFNH